MHKGYAVSHPYTMLVSYRYIRDIRSRHIVRQLQILFEHLQSYFPNLPHQTLPVHQHKSQLVVVVNNRLHHRSIQTHCLSDTQYHPDSQLALDSQWCLSLQTGRQGFGSSSTTTQVEAWNAASLDYTYTAFEKDWDTVLRNNPHRC